MNSSHFNADFISFIPAEKFSARLIKRHGSAIRHWVSFQSLSYFFIFQIKNTIPNRQMIFTFSLKLTHYFITIVTLSTHHYHTCVTLV